MAKKPTYEELEKRVSALEKSESRRKRAEKALKESEAYLRTILRTIPELVWMKDPDGVYLFCNVRFEQFFGAKEKDIVGKTDYDFVDKEQADFFRRNDKLAIEKGDAHKNEEEVTYTTDGHHETLATIKTPIYLKDGQVAGVLGIGRDITEYKQAEKERKATVHFFESLDKINRAIQAASDLKQVLLDVLDEALAVFGCDRAFLLYPLDFDEASWEIPLERTRPEYPGAYAAGTPSRRAVAPHILELRRRLLTTADPVELKSGTDINPEEEPWKRFQIQSVLTIALHPKIGKPWQLGLHQCSYPRIWTLQEKKLFQEISRRLADGLSSLTMYQNLKESEDRFRTVFENAADAIFWNDLETGKFIDVNPAACRHLGYSKSEFLEMSLAQVRKASAFDPVAHFKANHNPDEGVFFEVSQIRKDGSIADVEVSSQQLVHQGRKTLLSIVRDVTNRKQTEAELAQYRENLEMMVDERTAQLSAAQKELVKKEKLAVLGQLTATVSHELRNPLGVIRSSNYFMERRLKGKDEKIDKHLKRIEEQVELCDIIVADLLEYTRGRDVVITKSDISPLLAQVIAQVKEQEKIKIDAHIAKDLALVPHDLEKMRRVIINLLNNAIQATKAKLEEASQESKEDLQSYNPSIRLNARMEGGKLVIRVEDNGIGMTEETLSQAFEPLFTTRARGTGLGLAIVKKIIEEHKGSISLESRQGEGTRVTLTLPVV